MKPCVVDLYHGDAVESFAVAAQAGIVAVIHKATQGTAVADPAYVTRRAAACAAGLLWGAYHFGTSGDIPAQVDHFLAIAQPDARTLLALDWEPDRGGTMSLAEAKQFLALVADRTGRLPVLYSGSAVKEALAGTADAELTRYRLWLCEYGPRAIMPPGWDTYWLWQYTGDSVGPTPHTCPGIPGAGGLDLNVYAGSAAQLTAEWAGAPLAASAADGTAPALADSLIDPVPAAAPRRRETLTTADLLPVSRTVAEQTRAQAESAMQASIGFATLLTSFTAAVVKPVQQALSGIGPLPILCVLAAVALGFGGYGLLRARRTIAYRLDDARTGHNSNVPAGIV